MPNNAGKDEGSMPPTSQAKVAGPDESALHNWLEGLLNSPPIASPTNGIAHSEPTNGSDSRSGSRLVLWAEVGPLVNNMGRISEYLDATHDFLGTLVVDYRVHEIRYSNPFLLAIDIETLAPEVAQIGGNFGVAYLIARSLGQLLDYKKEMADRERAAIDNEIAAKAADSEVKAREAEADRDAAKARLEQAIDEAFTELVKQVGRDDVDPDEVRKKADVLAKLELRVSNEGTPTIEEHTSTDQPIDLRVVAADDQGK
jgi:hypothetical protein